MRKINYLVLHCTATLPTATIKGILDYWKKELGWKNPGYHHLISFDGTIHDLLPIEKVSNGVSGHNNNSIHISYVGGIDAKGKAVDTRSAAQIAATIKLLNKYKPMFPNAKILGHRDFPGVKKACPSFNVSEWLKKVGL